MLMMLLQTQTPAPPVHVGDVLLSGFIVQVLPYLFTGMTAVLAWALVALQKKLSAQAQQTTLSVIGAKTAHFAELVVHDIEATLRPYVNEVSKDGTLTKAEANRLREEAIKRVKELLGEQGIAQLRSVFSLGSAPQVERYLQGEVEKAVADLPS